MAHGRPKLSLPEHRPGISVVYKVEMAHERSEATGNEEWVIKAYKGPYWQSGQGECKLHRELGSANLVQLKLLSPTMLWTRPRGRCHCSRRCSFGLQRWRRCATRCLAARSHSQSAAAGQSPHTRALTLPALQCLGGIAAAHQSAKLDSRTHVLPASTICCTKSSTRQTRPSSCSLPSVQTSRSSLRAAPTRSRHARRCSGGAVHALDRTDSALVIGGRHSLSSRLADGRGGASAARQLRLACAGEDGQAPWAEPFACDAPLHRADLRVAALRPQTVLGRPV